MQGQSKYIAPSGGAMIKVYMLTCEKQGNTVSQNGCLFTKCGLPSIKDLIILLELEPLLHPLEGNNPINDLTREVTFVLKTVFSVHEL